VIGVARTTSVPAQGGDRASIGALFVYAAAVAVVVSLPVVRRLYLPPHPSAGFSAFLGPYYGGPTAVDELVTAPQFTTSQAERSAHVSRTWEVVGGVGANVVTVNPKPENVNVVLGLANGTVLSQGRFGRESFGSMVRRFKPRVAINGTYFNLRTSAPVGALVMEGRLIYDGLSSAVLTVGEDGQVRIEYHRSKFGRDFGWAGTIRTAIGAGPMLLRNGRVALTPYDEGFGDPSIFAVARRSAVGVNSQGKLLLVTVHTPVTLNKLAHIMLKLGSVDAMALDGGTSSALYSNGEYITKPGRALTNLILIYD
jgi:exopolysaccharide biosynthesis protein